MKTILKSIAAVALMSGFLATGASANLPPPGEGLVLVPPAKQVTQPAVKREARPAFKRAKIVAYASSQPAGSIVIDTRKNVLYYVLGNGKAAKYRIATAKPGFEWAGTHKVSMKKVWPDWRPPAEMRKRRPDLPAFMPGGPENPLGARAIYLGSSIYRIHGTNEPSSIGKRASSGCIRMLNEDVSELYRFVKIGASVTVI
jgi:lipoprotein-anchoring transpeptidase ErfK/SrfK